MPSNIAAFKSFPLHGRSLKKQNKTKRTKTSERSRLGLFRFDRCSSHASSPAPLGGGSMWDGACLESIAQSPELHKARPSIITAIHHEITRETITAEMFGVTQPRPAVCTQEIGLFFLKIDPERLLQKKKYFIRSRCN